MFERQDWTLFRNLGTLGQKAGVPLTLLRRLVLKELVDNALDASGSVTFGKSGHDTYWVEDDGPGIPASVDQIARIFSVNRPLASTKLVRVPSRGALGNGLRVVVGAVLASGGYLTVETRGKYYKLVPQDDGTTRIADSGESAITGTRVTVILGDAIPEDRDGDDLVWASLAKEFRHAKQYTGKSSVYWYDSDSWYELLLSAGDRSVGELVALFHGFGSRRREKTPADVVPKYASRSCGTLTRQEADDLLGMLRNHVDPVPVGRIGKIGAGGEGAYCKEAGTLRISPGRGHHDAMLPYVVEVFALENSTDDENDNVRPYVNGTPITGAVQIYRSKATEISLFGCGLQHRVTGVSKKKALLIVNVVTPYMPITTDGKEPDLSRYLYPLSHAITRATRKLKTNIVKSRNAMNQKDTALTFLMNGVAAASEHGKYQYSLRQLFYAVRPYVQRHAENGELDYNYFARVITDYEMEHGDLPMMYRDPRGTLYHPHLGREIPLGTLAVNEYERPEWTFNKVLYCEKEGFTHLLRSVGWPERNDCALLSSKGFASRAVRDVIDLLGETDEEITFYCIHDADASGTLIYQALQEGTRARAARKVRIVNLGLDPWEALAAGLEVENFTRKNSRNLPVAAYVREQQWTAENPDEATGPEGEQWEDWLQHSRVELNAMTSPQFIAWLDRKISPHHAGKVVPPETVLRTSLEAAARERLTNNMVEDLMREHNVLDRVAQAMQSVEKEIAEMDLTGRIAAQLTRTPQERWNAPIHRIAAEITESSRDSATAHPAQGPRDPQGHR